jgi:hypothetical protein
MMIYINMVEKNQIQVNGCVFYAEKYVDRFIAALQAAKWEVFHAGESRDAQIQSGEASQRIEVGSGGEEPQAGNSDQAERGTGRKIKAS